MSDPHRNIADIRDRDHRQIRLAIAEALIGTRDAHDRAVAAFAADVAADVANAVDIIAAAVIGEQA